METEVWPNLLQQAHGRGVPMALANARLSERSARKGERLSALMAPAAHALDLVLAQTRDDAARLSAAGAREVEVSGNLKFDMAPDATLVARGRQWRASLQRPVVMMASSREGEEPQLLQAWLAQPAPRPLLLLVPRHPQRFDTVAQIVRDAKLNLQRRSQWTDVPSSDAHAADVWLGDSLGEMPLYYAASDVALLGGSFAPLGGQNLIEAAACACPVVMGPHTFNFEQAAENAVAERAALRVTDIDEGVARAIELTRDALHAQWSERAAAFAQMHKGAARRMAERIVQLAGARLGAQAARAARIELAG